MKYTLGYLGNCEHLESNIIDYCNKIENDKIKYVNINNMNKDLIDATTFNGFVFDTSLHQEPNSNEIITNIIKSNPDLDIMPVIIPNKDEKNFDSLTAISDELDLLLNITDAHTIPYKIESQRESKLFVDTVLSTFSEKTIKSIEQIEKLRLKSKNDLFNALKKIVTTLEFKDLDTRDHSRRVSTYAQQIAKKMGLSQKEINDIEIAGWVHDIGKLAINDEVLKSTNNKLSDKEFNHIKSHADIGALLLQSIIPGEDTKNIIAYSKHHHEKYNGSGYPAKISGEDIPLGARILCVADSFDAMTIKRTYNNPMTLENAISQLKNCSGTQFDPKIAEIFIDLLKNEPKKLKIVLDENGCIKRDIEPNKDKENEKSKTMVSDNVREIE